MEPGKSDLNENMCHKATDRLRERARKNRHSKRKRRGRRNKTRGGGGEFLSPPRVRVITR